MNLTRRHWCARSAMTAAALCAGPAARADFPADGGNRGQRLERRLAMRMEATYRVTISAPNLQAREWTVLCPRAPEHPAQHILSAECEPAAAESSDRGSLRQPLWRARIPVAADAPADTVSFTVLTRAQLASRKLVSGLPPAPVPPLEAELRKTLTAATSWFDLDAENFTAWLRKNRLERRPGEGETAFARRSFGWLADGCGYEYLAEMDRRASVVCQAGKSDCGGLSALWVATLRKAAIPARLLAGRWARSAADGEKIGGITYFQEHVKAEFFAAGVGWVPGDLSSAVVHGKRDKLRFFGNDPGDFLILHFDHDLVCDSGRFGLRTLPILQRAAYWASGRGNMDGARMTESWKVSSAPA